MRYAPSLLSLAFLGATVQAAKQCTTTIGLPGGCCPPDKSKTTTELIDCKGKLLVLEEHGSEADPCKGCALTSQTTGIICMMICPTPHPTVKGVTTVTSCSPTWTEEPYPTASPEPTGSMGIGPGFVACTKTITEHERPRCVYTKPAHTSTTSIDCQCCDLTTTTISPDYAIRCASPVTTIFNDKRTATETVCAKSTSCSIYW
jgi:hypothetical protein